MSVITIEQLGTDVYWEGGENSDGDPVVERTARMADGFHLASALPIGTGDESYGEYVEDQVCMGYGRLRKASNAWEMGGRLAERLVAKYAHLPARARLDRYRRFMRKSSLTVGGYELAFLMETREFRTTMAKAIREAQEEAGIKPRHPRPSKGRKPQGRKARARKG